MSNIFIQLPGETGGSGDRGQQGAGVCLRGGGNSGMKKKIIYSAINHIHILRCKRFQVSREDAKELSEPNSEQNDL